MYITIEKTDKKGAAIYENVELAFKRCTGNVEDKFYKALSKVENSNLQIKIYGLISKYIDPDAENQDAQREKALAKALKAGEITIEEVTELNNPNIDPIKKKESRKAKIEALQACAVVDSKYFKEFSGKPDNEFWQSVTTPDIDAAVAFFRATNRM